VSAIERASVCTFDCPDTCSLSVTVEDGRIAKVRGSEAAPFTAGVICNKVARDMTAFVHGPQRILHPLRRTGAKGSGAFERITWDAALDEIHARTSAVIERWGPQAVSPLNYAGPHGMLAGWARRNSIAARCAAACAARPGQAPMARFPAARRSSPQRRS
jgi:anaerobic selenocysteine-containing dehydrogenase